MKKLNIGCGRDYRKGFINIDAREGIGADIVHDINKPFPFKTGTIDEIVAQDVIEHLTVEQQKPVLAELSRILSGKGKVQIRIPDNEDIWKRFSDDPETKYHFVFGDTSESGIWGAHKSGHTPESFTRLAAMSGLKLSKVSSVTTNFVFEFVKDDPPKLKGLIFINQVMSMGGAENFNTQLLSWFKKRGIPVKAWTTFSPLNENLKSSGIKANKIPFIIDLIGDWKGLLKGLMLLPFAVVYYANLTYKNRGSGTIVMSGFIEKILVTPWAKIFNIPVVWIEFGPMQSIFIKFWGFPKLLYRLVSRLPDFVIVPSRNTRDSNVNITNLSTARTKVIPCGIAPLQKVSARILKQTAYCVSRMEKGKGQDLLIAAWPKVVKRFPRAKLFLIGEGDFRLTLEREVAKLNMEKSVIFLGRVEDLAKTIAPFSLAVLPTVWELEGLSLVFMEAMSIGKPIVCFKWGSNLDLVDENTALMVPKADIARLSNAIIDIFSNPRKGKKLGEMARKRFEKLFTITKTAPQYEEVFLEAQVASRVRSVNDLINYE